VTLARARGEAAPSAYAARPAAAGPAPRPMDAASLKMNAVPARHYELTRSAARIAAYTAAAPLAFLPAMLVLFLAGLLWGRRTPQPLFRRLA